MAGVVANLAARMNLQVGILPAQAAAKVNALATALGRLDTAYLKVTKTMASGNMTRVMQGNFAMATASINATTGAVAALNAELGLARAQAAQAGGATMRGYGRMRLPTGGGGGGAAAGAAAGVTLGTGARRAGAARGSHVGGFKDIAGAFVGMLVGGALLRGMGTFVERSSEMELALAQIQALTRASTEDLKAYEKQILKVAGKTPYDPKTIAQAALTLRQYTGSTSAAVGSGGVLMDAASLAVSSFGQLTPEQAAKFMGQLVIGAGGSTKVAKGRVAELFGLSRAIGINVSEFAPVAGKLGAAAYRGQQDFLTTAAMFAMGSQVGGGGKESATQVFRLMSEMAAGKAEAGFGRIGVATKSRGQLRPVDQVVGDVLDRLATGKVTQTQVMEALSGRVAGAGGGVPIGERTVKAFLFALKRLQDGIEVQGKGMLYGREALKGLTDEAKASSDILELIAERRLATFSGQLELMIEEMGKSAMLIGDQFRPALTTMVTGMRGLASLFQGMAQNPAIAGIFKVMATAGVGWVSIFATAALVKGAFRILQNAKNFAGLGTIRSGLSTFISDRRVPGGYKMGEYSRWRPGMNTGGGLGSPIAGLQPTMGGVGVMGRVLGGLGAFALQVGALYLAFKAMEEVVEAINLGWTKYWSNARSKGMLAGMQGSVFSPMSTLLGKTKAGKYLDAGGAQSVADAYRIKFGKEMGESSTSYQKDWLLWRYKNHFAIMREQVMLETQQNVKRMDILARQVTLQKQLNDTYQYGFERMNKILQETKTLADYEPPTIKWGTFKTSQRMLERAAAGGKLGQTENTMVRSMLVSSPEAEGLMLKAATGMATPEEHARLMRLLNMRQAGLTHLGASGTRGFSKSFAKKFGGDVTKQVGLMGTPENLLYSEFLSILGRGELRPGIRIPGFSMASGGIPGGPREVSGDYALFGNLLGAQNLLGSMPGGQVPMSLRNKGMIPPWEKAPTSSPAGGAFTAPWAALPMTQQAPFMSRKPDREAQAYQTSVQEDALRQLGGIHQMAMRGVEEKRQAAIMGEAMTKALEKYGSGTSLSVTVTGQGDPGTNGQRGKTRTAGT